MAGLAGALRVRRPLRPEAHSLWPAAVLAIVAFCVVYPMVLVVLQSFQVSAPGQDAEWGLDGWRAAFSEPTLRSSLLNTLTLTFTRQAISMPIAVGIAWLLARTNLPGRSWLEFGFWMAYFLPPLTVTSCWILLADPHYGLLNQLLGHPAAFNVYSFWGIVWVELATTAVTVKVILLVPAFRYMNSSFEEASRMSGAGSAATALRVTVPIMLPVILAVALIGTLASLQGFEIEQILGVPFRFFVFSTMIYGLIESNHPSYAPATALAVIVLLAMLPLVLLQLWATRRRRFTTVTGQFKNQLLELGRWRWAALAVLTLVLTTVLAVPLVFTTLGTFMTVFGFFTIAQPWTTANWQTTFGDALFLRSLVNTLELALGTAAMALMSYSVIAYIVTRTRNQLRSTLDFVSWLPFTVPGIILGLALLWLFLNVPVFRPLYGTVWILVLAGVITGMPLGVQIIKSSLLQLGEELEDAARLAGASWWVTYRRIVLRLLGPALLTVGLVLFVGATRNISYIALLSTSANQPLSILQLNYLAQGKSEVASVIAFIVMLASVGGALLARASGFRGAAL